MVASRQTTPPRFQWRAAALEAKPVLCVNPAAWQRPGRRGRGARRAPLGQRRHEARVVADEGGVAALALQQLADQLVQQARGRARRRAVDAALRALRARACSRRAQAANAAAGGSQAPATGSGLARGTRTARAAPCAHAALRPAHRAAGRRERRCERGHARRLRCSRARGLCGAEPDWREGTPRRDMPCRHAGACDKLRHARAVRGGRHAALHAGASGPPTRRSRTSRASSVSRSAGSFRSSASSSPATCGRASSRSLRPRPGTELDSAVGARCRQPVSSIRMPSAVKAWLTQRQERPTNLPCCAGTASPGGDQMGG